MNVIWRNHRNYILGLRNNCPLLQCFSNFFEVPTHSKKYLLYHSQYNHICTNPPKYSTKTVPCYIRYICSDFPLISLCKNTNHHPLKLISWLIHRCQPVFENTEAILSTGMFLVLVCFWCPSGCLAVLLLAPSGEVTPRGRLKIHPLCRWK
jgi:hypothetical protein